MAMSATNFFEISGAGHVGNIGSTTYSANVSNIMATADVFMMIEHIHRYKKAGIGPNLPFLP